MRPLTASSMFVCRSAVGALADDLELVGDLAARGVLDRLEQLVAGRGRRHRPLTVSVVSWTAMSIVPKPSPSRGSDGIDALRAIRPTRRSGCTCKPADDVVLAEALARGGSIACLLVGVRHGPVQRHAPRPRRGPQGPGAGVGGRRPRIAVRAAVVVEDDREHDQHEQRGHSAGENALGVHRWTLPHGTAHKQPARPRLGGGGATVAM